MAAALLRRQPDVRQAERTLVADTARIGMAVADLYPRISLRGEARKAHADKRTVGTAPSFSPGPLANWSFPNPRRRPLAGEAGARRGRCRPRDLFDGTVLTAFKKTGQALSFYAAGGDERTALFEPRDRSDRAFRLSDARYRAGAISCLDQTVAQTPLIDARARLAALDMRIATARLDLFKAFGGGREGGAAGAGR
jgi:outer membrane protein TolC